MESLDLVTAILHQRSDTKWRVKLITNIAFRVFPINNFPLGAGGVPEYIAENRSIMAMVYDKYSKENYSDNLCAFRCLSQYKFGNTTKRNIDILFNKWREYIKFTTRRSIELDSFEGIFLKDIPDFETCFNIAVSIYALQEDGCTNPVYKSLIRNKETLYLNLYGNHLSFIIDIKRYSQKYVCLTCKKHFKTLKYQTRHSKVCSEKTKFIFKEGYYSIQGDIFRDLEGFGIHIAEEERFFPWFAVFDYESYLKPVQSTINDSKLKWNAQHVPVSASVSSNIPKYKDAHCIIERKPCDLVDKLSGRLGDIREESTKLAKQKWAHVFDKLSSQMKTWQPDNEGEEEVDSEETGEAVESNFNEPPSKQFLRALSKPNSYAEFQKRLGNNEFRVQYNDWSDSESDSDNDTKSPENIESSHPLINLDIPESINGVANDVKKIMYNQLKKMYDRFNSYCNILPVLTFNGKKYDLVLSREFLPKYFKLNGKNVFTVKKNNAYFCIQTEDFRFLDITNYLAPGTNYSNFLKAFRVEESKEFFPYDWFCDVNLLDHTSLPPVEKWFSKLKGKNVLDDGNNTIEENYNYVQNIWKEKQFSTFSDYLAFYNNADVIGFVEGVERFLDFYKSKRVDVFKTTQSVPGISRHLLFKCAREQNFNFATFGKRDSDLYYTICDNLVGGPSIIFSRYQEIGHPIRPHSDKKTKNIMGYDANALYLMQLGGNLPIGAGVRYIKKENGDFQAQKRERFDSMYNWMDWLQEREGKSIIHRLNNSKEIKIGSFYVDGFEAKTNTIFEYHGCYYHGHDCDMTKNVKSKQWHERKTILQKRTKKRTEFFKSLGYNVREIYECEFKSQCKTDKELSSFISSRKPTFYRTHSNTVSESQILKAVKSGQFFGFVECDISIPDTWPEGRERHLPPKEYFAEMAPIFCNVEVNFEDIGQHMKDHILKTQGKPFPPRRTLVAGLRAEKILLASELLQYYMKDLDMLVTKVYQV